MKVYVAAPVLGRNEAETLANLNRAVRAGAHLISLGHTPHLGASSWWMEQAAMAAGQPNGWAQQMRVEVEWLRSCDALLYLGPAPETNLALAVAQDENLTIYTRPEEVGPNH